MYEFVGFYIYSFISIVNIVVVKNQNKKKKFNIKKINFLKKAKFEICFFLFNIRLFQFLWYKKTIIINELS